MKWFLLDLPIGTWVPASQVCLSFARDKEFGAACWAPKSRIPSTCLFLSLPACLSLESPSWPTLWHKQHWGTQGYGLITQIPEDGDVSHSPWMQWWQSTWSCPFHVLCGMQPAGVQDVKCIKKKIVSWVVVNAQKHTSWPVIKTNVCIG